MIPAFLLSPWLSKRTIYLTRHGSRAYGTSTPDSDHDFRGVAIPPAKFFYGYRERFEQAETLTPVDCVVYDIRKFFRLAADCNPSIIEALFTDPSDHVHVTELGKRLLSIKEMFLSRKAKDTFGGYAVSQLKKLKIGGDTKHAMHLVRLLKMGTEILRDGQVQVRRPDAEELLTIRSGKKDLNEVIAWAERQIQHLDELCARSPLPAAPKHTELDLCCVDLVEASFNGLL